MNSKLQWVALIAVAIIAIATAWYVFAPKEQPVGQAGTRFVYGVSIGNAAYSPTNLSLVKAGTCVLIGADAAQTGTSTAPYDCAITGVLSTDVVTLQIATTTSFAPSQCWNIAAAKASTTANFATAMLSNCGKTAIPSVTGVGSTTNYQVFRSQ